MRRSEQAFLEPMVFEKILFDSHANRYSFRLASQQKDKKMVLHLPVHGGPEDVVAVPLLLTDPMVRNLLRGLRIRVADIFLEEKDGKWQGRARLKWGLFRKTLFLRLIDIVRLSIEFHKPILVPRNQIRPLIHGGEGDETHQGYHSLFMSRRGRGAFSHHEEIM